jgi:hypothetical protein
MSDIFSPLFSENASPLATNVKSHTHNKIVRANDLSSSPVLYFQSKQDGD